MLFLTEATTTTTTTTPAPPKREFFLPFFDRVFFNLAAHYFNNHDVSNSLTGALRVHMISSLIFIQFCSFLF